MVNEKHTYAAIHAIVLGRDPSAPIASLTVRLFGAVDAVHIFTTMNNDQIEAECAKKSEHQLLIQTIRKVANDTFNRPHTACNSVDDAMRKIRDLVNSNNCLALVWSTSPWTLIDHRAYVWMALTDKTLIRTAAGSFSTHLLATAVKELGVAPWTESATHEEPTTGTAYGEQIYRRASSMFGEQMPVKETARKVSAPPQPVKADSVPRQVPPNKEADNQGKQPPKPPALPIQNTPPTLPASAKAVAPPALPPSLPPKLPPIIKA